MKVSTPIEVRLPAYGVRFAESVHAPGFTMATRRDPFHKLIYVLQGRVCWQEDGRPSAVPAEAGTLLVVPRGTSHAIADLELSTLLLLCIGDGVFRADAELGQLWRALVRLPDRRLRLPRPARPELEAMWRRAMWESRGPRLGSGAAVQALAAQTLVLLVRLPPAEAGDDSTKRVAAVVREMEGSFYEDWSLDRAAARAGLSRRRCSELFRRQCGRTFREHLTALRLEQAARLLETGAHSVLGAAFSCGFNDLTHFYRLFRRRFGAPPRAWLARGRAGPTGR